MSDHEVVTEEKGQPELVEDGKETAPFLDPAVLVVVRYGWLRRVKMKVPTSRVSAFVQEIASHGVTRHVSRNGHYTVHTYIPVHRIRDIKVYV